MEKTTKSAKETQGFGRKIAHNLIEHKRGKETVIILALTGDLGSGKTTFVQGLAKGLGIKKRVISPTFMLMRKYDISINHQPPTINNFYHVDLYRLEENVEKEAVNLGVKDIWSDPENIVAIEWAEKIKDIIPKDAIWIKFENAGRGKRKITLMANH